MNKEDQELAQTWIAALRSGDYQQTTGVLRNPDTNGFCCLGVLCDLVQPEGWELTTNYIGTADNNKPAYEENFQFIDRNAPGEDVEFHRNIETEIVPDSLSKRILGGFLTRERQRTIATMNDEERSFEDIADWLEERLVP